jgi:hypothetical protein
MGMSKLFRLNDPRVGRVLVKGDLIISETNRNSGYLPGFSAGAE